MLEPFVRHPKNKVWKPKFNPFLSVVLINLFLHFHLLKGFLSFGTHNILLPSSIQPSVPFKRTFGDRDYKTRLLLLSRFMFQYNLSFKFK
jgi:hypothetical protein